MRIRACRHATPLVEFTGAHARAACVATRYPQLPLNSCGCGSVRRLPPYVRVRGSSRQAMHVRSHRCQLFLVVITAVPNGNSFLKGTRTVAFIWLSHFSARNSALRRGVDHEAGTRRHCTQHSVTGRPWRTDARCSRSCRKHPLQRPLRRGHPAHRATRLWGSMPLMAAPLPAVAPAASRAASRSRCSALQPQSS